MKIEFVEYLHVVEDLNSNTEHECLCMENYTPYGDYILTIDVK
jgi:hypothetical protein